MSKQLLQYKMTNTYMQEGRDALRTAIECFQNNADESGYAGVTTKQAYDTLEWSRRAIEQFSLALHIFENSNWVEEEAIDHEIVKLLKSAVRLQGIVLYNLQLMKDAGVVSQINQYEHRA